ncbi:Hypothetical_protein [Hexamita inflata]|uniref:Hypothetical_protein n=1 Tax=Hexamita inflata TaxID=28002 RepID=A0AA86U3X8_9EUKA|nr:Hypothetical protein HINF_LOCUS29085 [Hexamita inflata]
MKKFPSLNHIQITTKQVSYSDLITPKLAHCSTETNKNFNIFNIKPLNIKEKETLSVPTLQQVSNIIDETFEFDSNDLKQIFNQFIVNIDVDINLLECANQIRKSIKSIKINSQRLDELLLQVNAQSNSMHLLCSKQMSMIQNHKEYK